MSRRTNSQLLAEVEELKAIVQEKRLRIKELGAKLSKHIQEEKILREALAAATELGYSPSGLEPSNTPWLRDIEEQFSKIQIHDLVKAHSALSAEIQEAKNEN